MTNWLTDLINNNPVCRKDPATQDLLITGSKCKCMNKSSGPLKSTDFKKFHDLKFFFLKCFNSCKKKIINVFIKVFMRKHTSLILVFPAKKTSRKSEKKMVQNSKVIKNCRYHASQLFQRPILLRDPDQTNHTQNEYQSWKVELGLQLQLFLVYI